ncbi:MAG: flagellar biosynthesis protein FlhA [Deltaproteobacteria bacterium]|jgi:flagellar biosynthesis protein FlhA|nr:MAG: flagellar biosynthesis protein FlhA [Deltaproteobacteria bacterium]
MRGIKLRKENIVAIGVVIILGMMIIPIPPFLLDILFSLSISLSIVILVTSIYIKKPLDFSIFPSLLLIVTLYRLSLNIASTRLILLKGSEGIDAAGQVIKSFGSFVVGGNYVVGFTVFLILIVINFVVITKGAGRIAEVAARFILDSMPGKQMAIDADLNAGLINEEEARKRRELIAQEADFYGAMDGASKFVRGDAIAGLIITGINIIVGFIIGTLQQGMPVSEAAKTYTILTIGDSLISQIPALLVSTAAGIVVSRAGVETDFGEEITKQVLVNPKSLATASGIILVLGLVPGMPLLPFFIFSLASGIIAYMVSRIPLEEKEEEEVKEPPQESHIDTLLEIEPLTFEIGYGLIPLVESETSGLLSKIKSMRRQIASELGFVVSPIHIKDNLQLRPHEYVLLLRGMEVARGEVMMGYWLAVPSEKAERIDGIPTKEPAFGLPAFWISEKDVESAKDKGYMVVDTATVIITHLTEVIKSHAWELLTRTEVQSLLDNVAKKYPKLVEELIPTQLTLGGVQRVLQNLLKERVPIKDIVTILETLLDYAPSTKDTELLTEYVRQALSRVITKQYLSPDGLLYVMTLDPAFESAILDSMEDGGALDPGVVNSLIKAVEKAFSSADAAKLQYPIILCSSRVRRFLRKITERFLPSVIVLSSAEILPSVKPYVVGVIRYEN